MVLLPFLPGSSTAQQAKNDYNWTFGYGPMPVGYPEYNGTLLDFNKHPVEQLYFNIPVDLQSSAVISDSLGKLLFYSNGCKILTAGHKLMQNGDKINEGGWVYEHYCGVRFGYPSYQGLLILPFPGRHRQYIMLHLHRPDDDTFNKELLYTTIDMTQDSGRGAVTLKNQLAYQGDTLMDMLTAVRHANGRDWWVVVPKTNSLQYFVSLLDDRGLHPRQVQTMHRAVPMNSYPVQAVFSPNGRKYATMDVSGHLQVFDFDRCAGQLSNPRRVAFPDDTISACGVAISPSSRYLYVSTTTKLYQFDLLATDLAASRQYIAYWDGHIDPQVQATTFFAQMLAPDGQIYMMYTNSNKTLHIIHHPDRPGKACDFEQRGVQLLTWNFSIPNFPHFRLFDVPGSPCDTLGINGPQPPEDTLVVKPPLLCAGGVQLYPNPATTMTTLELPNCQGGTLTVYDVTGRQVQVLPLEAGVVSVPVDLSRYVSGVYMLHVRLAGGGVVVRSLAVVR